MTIAETTRARAEALQISAQKGARITLTDLSRSNSWRKTLSSKGVLELVDRSDTTAFILSVDAMNDLLQSLNDYEAELETLCVKDLFEARKERTQLHSGLTLQKNAIESFNKRREQLHQVLAAEQDNNE